MSNWQYRRGDSSRSFLTFPFEFRLRIVCLGGMVLLAMLILAGNLFWIQIWAGEEHRQKILRQSIRRIRIPAQRGKILSRNLTLLAGNLPGVSLVVYPEEMRQSRQSKTVAVIFDAIGKISRAIGRENPFNRDDVLWHLRHKPGLPMTIFSQLDSRELARALEVVRGIDGIELGDDEQRDYPQGSLAAHLIGYARSEDPKQAFDRQEFFYYVSDLAGKDGLEKAFDRLPEEYESQQEDVFGLRGMPGYSVSQVDHLGYIRQKELEYVAPKHGNNIVLCLDMKAQKIAESLLAGKAGAMVVLDAETGDVIACASAPAMNLSRYSPVLTREYYQSLREHPGKPLVNRCFRENYTPGSILKPLVALAFLNAGIPPSRKVVCDGATQIGNATVRCASWRMGGHGELDMTGALAHSCNDYMLECGMETGLKEISRVLESAGIGRRTGVELPESAGIFPSDERKRRSHHEGWNRYDTALLSMGQGIVGVTPLQAAVYTAAIANGGRVMKPHLVYSVVSPDGQTLVTRKTEVVSRLAASDEHLQVVRRGMFEVVNSPVGSGREAKVEGLPIYGKTGSAEVGVRPRLKLVTWFVFFVTVEDRTYAGAIMIEGGSSGGRNCAPLAAEFCRNYFKQEQKK